MATSHLVTPEESQAEGIRTSLAVALGVTASLTALSTALIPFYGIGLLGIIPASYIGNSVGFANYTKGLANVDINWLGVDLFLRRPTDRRFTNGIQWTQPFLNSILQIPAPGRKYTLEMPGIIVQCQDGSDVYFGILGDPNSVLCSINRELAYIGAVKPRETLEDEWGDAVRALASKACNAYAFCKHSGLVDQFLGLAPFPAPNDHSPAAVQTRRAFDAFERALYDAHYVPDDAPPGTTPIPVFENENAEEVMRQAGVFQRTVQMLGICIDKTYSPNIGLSPELAEAEAQKLVAEAQMKGLETRAHKVRELARAMAHEKDGLREVSHDTALKAVMAIDGQDVKWTDAVNRYPDLSRAGLAIAKALIEAFKPKEES